MDVVKSPDVKPIIRPWEEIKQTKTNLCWI